MVGFSRLAVLPVASLFLGLGLLTGPTAAAPACAGASANPPCGPIPVLIYVTMDQWKGLQFEGAQSMEFDATLSFYVNVDQDGFYYDQENPPIVTFRVNREPPWVKTTVEPSQFVVPIDDVQYLSQENGEPTEIQYLWETPLKITVDRLRDPTPDELGPNSEYIRRDGTFRVTISATSTQSILMSEVFGNNMGLQQGYGVRELRFVPEIAGVPWIQDEATGLLVPEDGRFPASAQAANSPSPAIALAILAVVIGAAWVSRASRGRGSA